MIKFHWLEIFSGINFISKMRVAFLHAQNVFPKFKRGVPSGGNVLEVILITVGPFSRCTSYLFKNVIYFLLVNRKYFYHFKNKKFPLGNYVFNFKRDLFYATKFGKFKSLNESIVLSQKKSSLSQQWCQVSLVRGVYSFSWLT